MSTIPNAITLTGYGLGLWWCVGGPTWAGLASIAADELDGYAARKLNQETVAGSILDSTADAALVPMSLMRLGTATETGWMPLIAAPPLLYVHAVTRADGQRPPALSVRAGIMLFTMLMETVKK